MKPRIVIFAAILAVALQVESSYGKELSEYLDLILVFVNCPNRV